MLILNKIWEKITIRSFMIEYGFTEVLYRSPNGEYTIIQENDGKDVYVEDIRSNGIQKISLKKDKMSRKKYKGVADVQVKNATWAIKTIRKNGNIKKRILYTKCNPKEIVGLPKPK